jgi:deoxyxylulose-5-phosphate synthase
VVLGTPTEFLTHAKPAAILARLGLDAEGLATRALFEIARTHSVAALPPFGGIGGRPSAG